MATKAEIDRFLTGPDYLALVETDREQRLMSINALSETRISGFLGWLFRPHEGHGLGDQAFREMMLQVWRTNLREELSQPVPTPGDLREGDFSDLLVHTEYRIQGDNAGARSRPIDLVLVSRRNRLVVAIANKFGSAVHSEQLTESRKGIAGAFPNFAQVLVYLDSDIDNKPDDDAWIALGYHWLVDLIAAHQQAGGLLNERALDALEQFKSCLLDDLAASSRSGLVRDVHIENILRLHEPVLEAFKAYRKQRRQGEVAHEPAVAAQESLWVEYHQRPWLWDAVLDQARHAAIAHAAKRAFGDRVDVTSGPAEIQFRLKTWSRLETDPDGGPWGPRVIAWRGREGRSKYKVWAAVNLRNIRPELDREVRDAMLGLRESATKTPPKAAQWVQLPAAENLDVFKASDRIVAELGRMEAVYAALLGSVAGQWEACVA